MFRREGFGRQSMSEKRKCHIDPRTTDVYQKAKGQHDGLVKGMSTVGGSVTSPCLDWYKVFCILFFCGPALKLNFVIVTLVELKLITFVYKINFHK
jgi:hypothetical protein